MDAKGDAVRRSVPTPGLIAAACLLLLLPATLSAAGSGVLIVSGGSVPTIVIDAPAPAPEGFIEVSAGPDGRCFRWTGRAVVHSNVSYDLYAAIEGPSALPIWLVDGPTTTAACGDRSTPTGSAPADRPWMNGLDATAARPTDVAIDVLVAPDADAAAVLAGVRLSIWAAAAL